MLGALLVVGGLGYWFGHPLHPNRAHPYSYLASRLVRLPFHWAQGRLAQPAKRLMINLDAGAWRTLTAARTLAIRRGLLPKEAKKWVPATLSADGGAPLDAKVRLKGDYPDHWAGPKWSLRIQLPPKAPAVWGMRTFSVQDPATREFLAEWLLHRLLRDEGLFAIRYDFGQLTLNGTDKGIFAIEESFGPELLAANGQVGGVLLKFDETAYIDPAARTAASTNAPEAQLFAEAPIEAFDPKAVTADTARNRHFQRAKALLAGVRAGDIPLDSAFDAVAAGRLYAICDLLGAHHATRWKNSRFAYAPRTNRLTLIAYDGNAGGLLTEPYPARWAAHHPYRNDDPPAWKARFFTSSGFRRGYRLEAERLTRMGFLEETLRHLRPETTRLRRLLYKDRPTYDVDALVANLTANRNVLRAWVVAGR